LKDISKKLEKKFQLQLLSSQNLESSKAFKKKKQLTKCKDLQTKMTKAENKL
jgi:hypothetical protein